MRLTASLVAFAAGREGTVGDGADTAAEAGAAVDVEDDVDDVAAVVELELAAALFLEKEEPEDLDFSPFWLNIRIVAAVACFETEGPPLLNSAEGALILVLLVLPGAVAVFVAAIAPAEVNPRPAAGRGGGGGGVSRSPSPFCWFFCCVLEDLLCSSSWLLPKPSPPPLLLPPLLLLLPCPVPPPPDLPRPRSSVFFLLPRLGTSCCDLNPTRVELLAEDETPPREDESDASPLCCLGMPGGAGMGLEAAEELSPEACWIDRAYFLAPAATAPAATAVVPVVAEESEGIPDDDEEEEDFRLLLLLREKANMGGDLGAGGGSPGRDDFGGEDFFCVGDRSPMFTEGKTPSLNSSVLSDRPKTFHAAGAD